MKKYVVMSDETKEDGTIDTTVEGFFDTLQEANELAEKEFERLSDDDLITRSVSIGEIDEKDLEDKTDWNSFNKVEIINELREE